MSAATAGGGSSMTTIAVIGVAVVGAGALWYFGRDTSNDGGGNVNDDGSNGSLLPGPNKPYVPAHKSNADKYCYAGLAIPVLGPVATLICRKQVHKKEDAIAEAWEEGLDTIRADIIKSAQASDNPPCFAKLAYDRVLDNGALETSGLAIADANKNVKATLGGAEVALQQFKMDWANGTFDEVSCSSNEASLRAQKDKLATTIVDELKLWNLNDADLKADYAQIWKGVETGDSTNSKADNARLQSNWLQFLRANRDVGEDNFLSRDKMFPDKAHLEDVIAANFADEWKEVTSGAQSYHQYIQWLDAHEGEIDKYAPKQAPPAAAAATAKQSAPPPQPQYGGLFGFNG